MARPLGYDPQEVRRRTLEAFWTGSYAETSLADLEAATGLDRRQLYNGFGDKTAMFVTALEDFDAMAGQMFLAPLEAEGSGLAEIAGLLRGFVELSRTPEGRRGCLVCNTAREAAADLPTVRPRVAAYFDRIERAYLTALTQARNAGALVMDDAALRRTARLFFGAHVSLCVLARAGVDADVLHDIAEETLRRLG